MKIYAPKLTITNTDDSAPEVARINYGGQEMPIKVKTGEMASGGGLKNIRATIDAESTDIKNFKVGQNAQYLFTEIEKDNDISSGDLVFVRIITTHNAESDISGLYGIFQYNSHVTLDGNNYFDYLAGVINDDMGLQNANIYYANIIIEPDEGSTSGIILYRSA